MNYKQISLIILISVLFPLNAIAQKNKLIIARPELFYISAISATKVLKEAYKRLNIEIEYKTFPAKRSLHESNEGKADGEQRRVAGIEKEFPNLIRISTPIAYTHAMAFTKKNGPSINKWADLSELSVGYIKGSVNSEKMIKSKVKESVKNGEQLFMKLDAGRNDVIIYPQIGECIIKRLNLKNIKSTSIQKTVLYHYLNKKHQDIIPRVEKVLKELSKEGFIQKSYIESRKEYLTICPQNQL